MKTKNFLGGVWGCILLVYLAILPVSSTVALRNVTLLSLIVLGVFSLFFFRGLYTKNIRHAIATIPRILWVWFLFLFLFPLFSKDWHVALVNVKGEWLEGVLAFFVSFCAVIFISRFYTSLWAFALASLFPLALHLIMAFLAWGGVLEKSLPDNVSISSVVGYTWGRYLQMGWHWQMFPWGFRGLEPMHGNLGYTACQGLALLCAIFFQSLSQRKWIQLSASVLCIATAFASILIADSRGAIIFGFLLCCSMAVVYFLRCSCRAKREFAPSFRFKVGVALLLIALGILFSSFAYLSFRSDSRWALMLDKIEIGVDAPDPVGFLCNGISDEYRQTIHARYASNGEEYIDELMKGLEGQDGGRILLMRTAFKMVQEHPFGLDGSRYAFKELMALECGHPPVLAFAHSHEGWFDTALALGWAGAVLYASLLMYFALKGWAYMTEDGVWPFAFALFGIGLFWLLRGTADSMYREHYLQMQALVLGVLYFRIRQPG